MKDQGSIADDKGVTHNLTSSNKFAISYEVLVGSALADTDALVKIAPAGQGS